MLPSGDWHCPNCICKFCGDASENASEENDTTDDDLTKCSFCEKKCNRLYGFEILCSASSLIFIFLSLSHRHAYTFSLNELNKKRIIVVMCLL